MLIINSIVSTVLLSLLSLCTFALRDWFVEYSKRLNKWLNSSNVKLEVFQYEDRYVNNIYYTSLNWYFSQPQVVNTMKNLKLFRSKMLLWDCLFPITGTKCHHVLPNNIQVKFKYKEHQEGSGANTYISKYIELTTGNGTCQDLIAFTLSTKSAWEAHTLTALWSQQVFTHKDKVWTGSQLRNTRTWENVSMDPKVKMFLRNDVDSFLANETWYENMGIAWTRGYMLDGPPGSGKTSIVKAISNAAKLDIYILRLSSIQTDSELELQFSTLPNKCLVLMEDIDCMSNIVHKRSDQVIQTERLTTAIDLSGDKVSFVTLSCLLNLIDGVVSGHGRVLVMTTNHCGNLDPALIRPGRCDVTITMTYCTVGQLDELYQMFMHVPLPIRVKDCVQTSNANISTATVCGIFLKHQTFEKEGLFNGSNIDDALINAYKESNIAT